MMLIATDFKSYKVPVTLLRDEGVALHPFRVKVEDFFPSLVIQNRFASSAKHFIGPVGVWAS